MRRRRVHAAGGLLGCASLNLVVTTPAASAAAASGGNNSSSSHATIVRGVVATLQQLVPQQHVHVLHVTPETLERHPAKRRAGVRLQETPLQLPAASVQDAFVQRH